MVATLLALLILGAPPATAPEPPGLREPEQQRLRQLVAHPLDTLMADGAFKNASVTMAISRVHDQLELYAYHGDSALVPASNVKIITTAAALSLLSTDYQFTTEVYGHLQQDGRVEGDLIFKGYGDPYLLPEKVWYLCNRLRFLGVREVTGNVVVDDTYFEGERQAYGWQEDHTTSAYMAPAGALSVGFNAALIHVFPGMSPHDDARVMVEPPSAYPAVTGKVATISRGRTSVHVDMAEQNGADVIKVSGQIRVHDSPRGVWRRVSNTPVFAGHVLHSILKQAGIAVHGTVVASAVPPATPLLLRFASPRLAELVGPLNKYSNNFMASQLAYTLGAHVYGAPGTWDKGRRAIEGFLNERVALKPGSYTLRNASGLHEVNLFSARQMVQLLTYMYRQPQVWPEFVNSLAVAGGTGTLQDRMQSTHALHVLRAKTGTLAGACALSGYVPTRDGTLMAFSIIVNGFKRVDRVWAAQDRLADYLATLDLTPPKLKAPPPTLSSDTTDPTTAAAGTLPVDR